MKRAVLIFACALGINPLFAGFTLDSVMDKDTQKMTGVSTLSPNQKIALETWLNANFNVKTDAAKEEEKPVSLSVNIKGGQQLQLSDGSTWEVDPQDYYTSSTWLTPVQLKITPSNSATYPFWLTNKTSGQGVKARKISQQDRPPAP